MWELYALLGLWTFRYTRTIGNTFGYFNYTSTPIPEDPTYSPEDVTIILPTIATGGEELNITLRTCLRTGPHEVILVTVESNVDNLTRVANAIDAKKIRVLSIQEANKRRQMCRAIPEVVTPITVFVDDDVVWPTKVLQWMLAPFEDAAIGGVGTSQTLKRPEKQTGWCFLGAAYLERRNFDCSSCLYWDGGLPCLSGRTVAYRTSILQDTAFMYGFTHEEWRTCQLNADDDNFITRWLYSHDWKITMQYHKEAEVQTTLEDNPMYLSQCVRWVRSNWRSNLRSLMEAHYWRNQLWSTYSVLQTTITAWALPTDAALFYLALKLSHDWESRYQTALLVFLSIWIFLFTKTVKLWSHFWHHPSDLLYLPLYISFGYFHGGIKLWGLLTLNETTWGSREGADDANSIRMIRLPRYDTSLPNGRKSMTFDNPHENFTSQEQLPAYAPHESKRIYHD